MYTRLIQGFVKRFEIGVAVQLLESMMSDANIVPDTETFDRVLKFVSNRDPNKAMSLVLALRRLKKRQPDISTFLIMMILLYKIVWIM